MGKRFSEASNWGAVAVLALAVAAVGSAVSTADSDPALIGRALYIEPGSFGTMKPRMEFSHPTGKIALGLTGEGFDTKGHPFFEPQRTNGRACLTCHQPAAGMSLSVDMIRERWETVGPKHPLFAAVDGSNCPNLPQGKRESHSLLLERGLFRIAMPWPPRAPDGTVRTPEFTLEVVEDPTGCNTDPKYGMKSGEPTVSVYRRPRQTANLRYLETAKYDYNAKVMMPLEKDPFTGARSGMSMMSDARATSLKHQMLEAGRMHLQMEKPWSEAQIEKVVDFERRLHLASSWSKGAGDLTEPGGPPALGVQAMIDGRSHLSGNDRDTGIFYFFDQWKPGGTHQGKTKSQIEFRNSVWRGYDIFFNRGFWISDTYGINNIRLGNPYKQTCGFCHNTQLTGHDDVPGWMDIGTQNFPHAFASRDLPMFKITCKASVQPHPYLGRTIYTHDPGRALQSGRCEDVGGIVMQPFRGVASRAPYFSNGSARSLRDVIDFYDRRYRIGFSEQERLDLINFLSVL